MVGKRFQYWESTTITCILKITEIYKSMTYIRYNLKGSFSVSVTFLAFIYVQVWLTTIVTWHNWSLITDKVGDVDKQDTTVLPRHILLLQYNSLLMIVLWSKYQDRLIIDKFWKSGHSHKLNCYKIICDICGGYIFSYKTGSLSRHVTIS